MAGIVGYGAHLPRHRIKVEEIAKVWGQDAESYKKGLMLREKSVPPPDMDTITLSVEAARRALKRAVVVKPIGDRRDVYRLGVASVRGEAVRHDSRRGDRRDAGYSLRGFRVRLQGGLGGDVCRAVACQVGLHEVRAGDRGGYVAGRARSMPSNSRPRPERERSSWGWIISSRNVCSRTPT